MVKQTLAVAAFAACALLPLPACAETPPPAREIAVSVKAVPLSPGDPDLTEAQGLLYRGGIEIRSDDPAFGGLSGLVVTADGARFLAVTDRGSWLWGALVYDDRGHLAGLADLRMAPVLDETGRPLGGNRADAEALTAAPDGDLSGDVVLAFERDHRLARYAFGTEGPSALAVPLPVPGAVAALPNNGGLEAIALRGDGTLVAISEDGENADGTTQGWVIGADGLADGIALRRDAPFAPTDMTLLPGGDLLVLERRFSPLTGVAVRLRRIGGGEIAPGATLDAEVIAVLGMDLTVDNMEGLGARAATNGETHVYVVSDDNFNAPVQRNLLLMFALKD